MSAPEAPTTPAPAEDAPARRKRRYDHHALYALQRAADGIDPTSPVGQVLEAWRTDLVADLGGTDAISTQQAALIDLAVRSKLLLDSVDAWLFKQKSLVYAKRKTLIPALRERQSLVNGLQSLLRDLGLERKAREVPTLADHVRRHTTASVPAAGTPL